MCSGMAFNVRYLVSCIGTTDKRMGSRKHGRGVLLESLRS